jgi:peptidoglycan hydrolase CwlO-like protein
MTGWLEKIFDQLSPAVRHAVMFVAMGAIVAYVYLSFDSRIAEAQTTATTTATAVKAGDAKIESKLEDARKAVEEIKVHAAATDTKVDGIAKDIENQNHQLDRIETMLESRPPPK